MHSIHILLVEDNEGDILLTKEALNQGIIVETISVVKDGKEAIKYLEKVGPYSESVVPDLIILDINLPKMNGHEVLKNIKGNDNFKQIPVVMFTTSSTEKDIMDAYKNHANCYITKPNEVDEFLKTVTLIKNFWISIVHLPTTNHPIK